MSGGYGNQGVAVGARVGVEAVEGGDHGQTGEAAFGGFGLADQREAGREKVIEGSASFLKKRSKSFYP
jgi:hypothetical protein